ncbi:MAG: hypothetical protein M1813_008756 [Trichoglossum hirsutum]|nr:MAG: hypothetical protein M1813_008756 [Trichoglossum hirsutum]
MNTTESPAQGPPSRPATPNADLPSTLEGENSSHQSTPIAKRGDSGSEDQSDTRAESLLNNLRKGNKLWIERTATHPRTSAIDQFLSHIDDQYHAFAEIMQGLPEICTFIRTAGKGVVNEDEFSHVISAITSHLAASESCPRNSDVSYVRSGGRIMHPRARSHPWLKGEPTDKRFGLKPDFFTSRIVWDQAAGEYHPVSLSTVLHQAKNAPMISSAAEPKPRRSDRIAERVTNVSVVTESTPADNGLVTMNNGLFTWDDVQILWEIKSSKEINKPDTLSNLILKATEVLRYQWHRQFVLGFLVCGTQLRMIRFDRSGVFVGLPVGFDDGDGGATVLVKCILAGLVLPGPDIGFLEDFHSPQTILINGNRHLVISIDDQEFLLGDQIVGSQRDHLVSRATAVHLARKIADDSWKYCFKTAWPYTTRSREGSVLNELKGLPSVVRLLASNAPLAMTLTSEQVQDYRPQSFVSTIRATLISSESQQSITTNNRDSSTGEGTINDNSQPIQFHPREFRQTITDYVPESFGNIINNDLLDLLYAWRSLYLAVDAIAAGGWVHRDLSWNNVRICRHDNSDLPLSVTIIDFDLAASVIGPSTGLPDRTGTALFMPTEILLSTDGMPVRHQELHEDEAVFWVGFLALVSRSTSGQKYINANLGISCAALEQLATSRVFMLSLFSQRKYWPSWFSTEPPSSHPTAVSQQSNILCSLCNRIAQIQFMSDSGGVDIGYPGAEELDEQSGCRKHALQHKKILREVVEELDKTIEVLISLRQGDDERLVTMGMSLKVS